MLQLKCSNLPVFAIYTSLYLNKCICEKKRYINVKLMNYNFHLYINAEHAEKLGSLKNPDNQGVCLFFKMSSSQGI